MKTLLAKGALAAVSLAACANEPTAATAPQPTETPSATPPPKELAATASAKASAAAEVSKPSQSSGSPMVLKSDPSENLRDVQIVAGRKAQARRGASALRDRDAPHRRYRFGTLSVLSHRPTPRVSSPS